MHTFKPSTQVESIRSLSSELKPDWLIEQILGQLGLYKRNPVLEKERKKKKKKIKKEEEWK